MYNQMYSDKTFYNMAEPILRNIEFQRRRTYLHHNNSVYEHSLNVAWVAYKIAKKYEKLNINVRNVVISALLHDFYTIPWREYKSSILWKKHGFIHGNIACCNANLFFPDLMNKRIDNAIKRHMFPLTIVPPRYIEGWILTIADKYVSLEVFNNPKTLPRYIGIDFSLENIAFKFQKIYKSTERFVSHMY